MMKAAFIETRAMLPNGGHDLTFNGVTKKCIAGAIDRTREQMVVQSLVQYGTPAELLNEEFAAFGAIVENKTEGTVSGLAVVVVGIQTDDADPVTHLVLKAAR